MLQAFLQFGLCETGAFPIGAAYVKSCRGARDAAIRSTHPYGTVTHCVLGLEDHMSAAATEEINIFEKAKNLLPPDYVPGDDEEYMNDRQLAYFQMLLIEWKRSIRTAAGQTLQSLADGPIREADLNDRASSETDWGIELRTRDRQRKLVAKIDAALRRIEEGEYGYCEVTGDPIGLRRLIARPVATMTVEAQEAHERREKISRDD